LRTLAKAAWSRPVLIAAALAAGVLLAGEIRDHIAGNAELTAPRIARPSRDSQRWERAPLPDCPQLVTLKPPVKARARLERDFGVPLQALAGTSAEFAPLSGSQRAREVLAVRDLGRLPYGGETLVTLPPGGGEVEVTIKPKPRPFFELTGAYGMGGLYGVGDASRAWRAYVMAEPLRLGRWHLRGEAGVTDVRGDPTWYALAGAEWRPR
jgi:hypothetical protein